MLTDFIKTALAVSKKTGTRDGLIAVEYADVQAAAAKVGLRLDVTPHAFARHMTDLGAARPPKGHTGRRYGFAPGVLEQNTNGAPGVNHFDGCAINLKLTASMTLPQGVNVMGWDFVEGPSTMGSAADLTTIPVQVVDLEWATGERTSRMSQGAVVTLHIYPESEIAKTLAAIIPSEFNAGRAGPALNRAGACDRVSINVDFHRSGTEATLTGGTLISRCKRFNDHQFTFFFTDVLVDKDN